MCAPSSDPARNEGFRQAAAQMIGAQPAPGAAPTTSRQRSRSLLGTMLLGGRSGRGSTILTGAQGQDAATGQKNLLGA